MASRKNNVSVSAPAPATVPVPNIQLEKGKAADGKYSYELTAAEQLPIVFDYYEDAIDARNELKAKVDASKELLTNAECIFVGIMDDTPILLFAMRVPKRFEAEHEWYELKDVNGDSFGFVDADDDSASETYMVKVYRPDNDAMDMPIVELANPSNRKAVAFNGKKPSVSDILSAWQAGKDTEDEFIRLVAEPMLRDERLLGLCEVYLAEFAKNRLKALK